MTNYKSDAFIVDLPLLDPANADQPARDAMERAQQAKRELPNMYRAMAQAPGLLDTYLSGYARFRSESGFTPQEQEIVFLTISAENGCEYCVAAHSVIADKASQVPLEATNAIREGRPPTDLKLGALSSFTQHLLLERGRPSQSAADMFLKAGYTEQQMLYLVLALAVKTMSNYTNHLFHLPVDEVFMGRQWKADSAAI
jgi:AhpD family alkylhydroperoxidase